MALRANGGSSSARGSSWAKRCSSAVQYSSVAVCFGVSVCCQAQRNDVVQCQVCSAVMGFVCTKGCNVLVLYSSKLIFVYWCVITLRSCVRQLCTHKLMLACLSDCLDTAQHR
eukprot:13366-Heterococcus_DN1.PRE.9